MITHSFSTRARFLAAALATCGACLLATQAAASATPYLKLESSPVPAGSFMDRVFSAISSAAPQYNVVNLAKTGA